MSKVTKHLARKLAADCLPSDDEESVRDYLDIATGGDLDCLQLDLLCELVREAIDARH